MADRQTAGRGRRGRTWVSQGGNLHLSVLLSLPHGLATAAQIGFAAAVALAETLDALTPHGGFAVKWPNDVLAGGAKVAGMLLETEGDWLILGAGVNVAEAPPPGRVEFPADCLRRLGYDGDARSVAHLFLDHLAPWVNRWRTEGFAPVRAAWLNRCVGLDQTIKVRLPTQTLDGLFAGLDADGALLLDQGGDGVRRVLAGDVFWG